jgi:hypothetical protein
VAPRRCWGASEKPWIWALFVTAIFSGTWREGLEQVTPKTTEERWKD